MQQKFFHKKEKIITRKDVFFSCWSIFWTHALHVMLVIMIKKKINEPWSFLIENFYAELSFKCVSFADIFLKENIRVYKKCSLKNKQNLQLKLLKINLNEKHSFLNNKYYSFLCFYEFNEKNIFFLSRWAKNNGAILPYFTFLIRDQPMADDFPELDLLVRNRRFKHR